MPQPSMDLGIPKKEKALIYAFKFKNKPLIKKCRQNKKAAQKLLQPKKSKF